MIGLKSLLAMPAFVGPWALVQASPTHPPVIDAGALIPAGIVVLLIGAVWKAAREVERLESRLYRIEPIEKRLQRIEEKLGIED